MIPEYKTVYEGGEAEIVEKKSRFIATVAPIKTEEEAISFIEKLKKRYWDARHNCFAYVLGGHSEIQRYSDDGEPGGTAGRPMLDVLMGEELHDTAVVVTRYFGGTLLGTGGLVRAYSGAVQAGLASSHIITKIYGRKLAVHTDYTGLGKLQYILGKRGLTILETAYTESVLVSVLVPMTEEAAVTAELVETTNGQVQIEKKEKCYFANVGNAMKIFESEKTED